MATNDNNNNRKGKYDHTAKSHSDKHKVFAHHYDVESTPLLYQLQEGKDCLQQGGLSTSLEDDPVTCHEHAALTVGRDEDEDEDEEYEEEKSICAQ